MAAGSIFVVISCQGVADAIRDAIDHGRFAEARSLSYKANGLSRKLASAVQERGGHLQMFTYDRQVMEVPSTVAEDMPQYLDPYVKDMPGMVAAGLGLTFREAVAAMKASEISGEIEMYDPEDARFEGVSEYVKAEQPYELPVNMFDVTVPQEDPKPNQEGFVSRPEIEEELQAQAALIQAIAQVMGGGQQAQQPPQPEARDLREALEGGPVEGYQPQQPQGQEGQDKPQPKGEETEKEEMGSEGGSEVDSRLGTLLHSVKASLPQIMSLHDKNPAAYKAAMNLVQKLVAVAKERRVKKAEDITDELNKTIHLRLPVGARKGNKRKVLVGGKEVWRQMGAGQVQDAQGQPISVKSHNRTADGKE